jgi:hypothetical protein
MKSLARLRQKAPGNCCVAKRSILACRRVSSHRKMQALPSAQNDCSNSIRIELHTSLCYDLNELFSRSQQNITNPAGADARLKKGPRSFPPILQFENNIPASKSSGANLQQG